MMAQTVHRLVTTAQCLDASGSARFGAITIGRFGAA
jgi:hypothetical protein